MAKDVYYVEIMKDGFITRAHFGRITDQEDPIVIAWGETLSDCPIRWETIRATVQAKTRAAAIRKVDRIREEWIVSGEWEKRKDDWLRNRYVLMTPEEDEKIRAEMEERK